MIRYRLFNLSLLLVVLGFFWFPGVSLAASAGDSFTVSLFMGTDVSAPTIPGNFSVTPVSTSQIDLDWDASADNFSVAGYQVFRDSVQIATTTLTSYSDIGLTPATLYGYFVTAFDTSLNISTSTATLSTSTLAVAVVATTTPTTTPDRGSVATGGYNPEIEILNFIARSTQTTIAISFDTSVYTRAVIRWGRTINYESGFVASDTFKKNHQTIITGLEAGVNYEFEIILTDTTGLNELRYNTTIATDRMPDNEAPQNVSAFRALVRGLGVDLSWKNPSLADFNRVRVVSSDYFYPNDVTAGWLVYEGSGEAVTDTRPLPAGSARYYSIFVYDDAGNISSGAVTKVVRPYPVGTVVDPTDPADTTDPITPSPTTTPSAPFVFTDVQFIQDDTPLSVKAGFIELAGAKETRISLAYELLPEHLKTILVTLTDPDDPALVFSFLLRVNRTTTAYEALIGPLLKGGLYGVSVEVFDFKTQDQYQVSGKVMVTDADALANASPLSEFESTVRSIPPIFMFGLLLLLGLLIVLWLLRFFILKRREDKVL